MTLISEFYFEFKHIKGKESRLTYVLSRSVRAILLATKCVGEYEIKQRIKTLLKENEFFNQVKEGYNKNPKRRSMKDTELIVDDLISYKNKLYMTKSVYLRHLIIKNFYRRPYVGQYGYQKMIMDVRELCYCLGMKQDIVEYISKCLEYQ
jgi:hypothetical protein